MILNGASPRIPSLDGLRAVAISLVLYSHLCLSGTVQLPKMPVDVGYLGVLIFLVISGYIITILLLRSRSNTNEWFLVAFYVRRVARIVPALLCFLAVLAILAKLRLSNASPSELLWSMTFLSDYRISKFASLRHLWSLSVEEQFYVFWPLALHSLGAASARKLLAAVILVAPAIRLLYRLEGASGATVQWHFESVADGLAIGCLLAMTQPLLHSNRTYYHFITSRLPLFLPVLVWLGLQNKWPTLSATIGASVVFVSIAVGVDAAIVQCKSSAGRVLNSGVVTCIGRWSYSLYLWQQIFLMQSPGAQPYARFPLNLVLSTAVAALSFYLIEQPGIAWGRRLVRPVFPGAPPLRLGDSCFSKSRGI